MDTADLAFTKTGQWSEDCITTGIQPGLVGDEKHEICGTGGLTG